MPVINENPFISAASLIGNVEVPRNVQPLLRASVRRSDPDGSSTSPYYPGVSGKSITVEYTVEISGSAVPTTSDITFTGSSLATIISDINALDPANLEAVDLDGFLGIRDANPGLTHYVRIQPYATPANDAAPIFGFDVYPAPGSTSFAGEVAQTPANRRQGNPQSTALVAYDEDLSAKTLNRAFASVLQLVEDMRAELSRDVIVYKDIPLTFISHPVSPNPRVANINDDSIRLYNPTGSTATDIEPFFRIMNTDHSQSLRTTSGYPTSKITNIYYGTIATSLNNAAVFSTWGTPDGKSTLGGTVASKVKHAAVNITTIKNNTVYCSTADFNTALVKPGDPVKLAASNKQPFDHSGWFAVDGVIDSKTLVLRPMCTGDTEKSPGLIGDPKPRALNKDGGGTLEVHVGNFLPAGNIWIETNDTAAIDKIVRLPVGVKFKDTLIEDEARSFAGILDQLSSMLYDHITDTTDAHAASAITGFTTGAWANGQTSTGSTLTATINDIVADLSSTLSTDGSARLGGPVITITGSTPNTLNSGTIKSQLTDLLTKLRDHMNDGAAHAGAGAPYSGSPPWADGTTIPSGISIDSAIDDVVADLATTATGASGTHKIGIQELPDWATSPGPIAGTLYQAIAQIITDLGSTTFGDDGAHKIGTSLTADLSSGTIRSQLDAIATGWGKLNRANVWTAKQTFNGTASDTVASMDTTYTPTTRKLLWEALLPGGVYKMRMYAGQNDVGVGYEATVNARWDGSNWNKDNSGAGARIVLARTGFYIQSRLSGDSGVWTDTLGNWHDPLYLSAEAPATATAIGPAATPGNVCRAHAHIVCNGSGGFTSKTGFNVSIAMGSTLGVEQVEVTFPFALNSANYTVVSHFENTGGGLYFANSLGKSTTQYFFNVYHLSGGSMVLQTPIPAIVINFVVFDGR